MSGVLSRMLRAAYLVPLVLMVGGAVGMGVAISAYGLHLRKKPIYAPEGRLVNSLPVETLNWKRVGSDTVSSPEIVEVLGTENYLTRRYVRKDTLEKTPVFVELHVAYYTGMIDTVPHVPDRCLVGSGMALVKGGVRYPLKLDQSRWSKDADVTGELAGHIWYTNLVNQYGAMAGRVRLPRDPQDIQLRVSEFAADGIPGVPAGTKLYAGFFFIANGGTTPEAESVRLLAFDLKDEYAYYCKVQFSSSSVGSAQELADESSSLLNDILPDLMKCVPDWVEVQRGEYPADNPRRGKGAGA